MSAELVEGLRQLVWTVAPHPRTRPLTAGGVAASALGCSAQSYVLCWCVYLFTCVHVCVNIYAQALTWRSEIRGQRSTLGVILNCFPAYVWRRGLSLCLELSDSAWLFGQGVPAILLPVSLALGLHICAVVLGFVWV